VKIIYFSQSFFVDCDFPLIRELQRRGHDVRYYIPIASFNLKSSLLNLGTLYPHTGIYPFTVYEGFNLYRNEIDFSKCYVVNQVHKQKLHPANLLLMARLALSFIFQNPDVIQITMQPSLMMRLLYLVKKKLVFTVHDPFQHSGRNSKRIEKERLFAFRKISRLILLNKKQVEDFICTYKIPRNHIFLAKLGMYDSISRVKAIPSNIIQPYILFFGLIAEYKGLEFLMQAMKDVHLKHPKVKLVVAGSGEMYFDTKPFSHLEYIEIRNYYISVPELSGLLNGCLFCVCPYKDATQSGVVQTAFSMGVPMIVTNVGALSESVHNGETGLVIPPCNISALIEAMNKLIDDRDYLQHLKNNIENTWKKEMSWDSIADSYEECYSKKL
jgi:glycosyltransferase involved in cell wall biosynthesis